MSFYGTGVGVLGAKIGKRMRREKPELVDLLFPHVAEAKEKALVDSSGHIFPQISKADMCRRGKF